MSQSDIPPTVFIRLCPCLPTLIVSIEKNYLILGWTEYFGQYKI